MSRFYSIPGHKYKIAYDCRHFPGDRPCIFHKKEGASCPCEHYEKYDMKILIIKLGALGDIIRTTPVIPALRKKYPSARISWVVEPSGIDLLSDIPELDRVIPYNFESIPVLDTEKFDLLYSLEVSIPAGGLAMKINAREKRGFGLDPHGNLFAFDNASSEYLLMSLSDPVKKANVKTYLEIFSDICDLPLLSYQYQVHYGEKERAIAEEFKSRHNLDNKRPVIGFFTGAGDRWKSKRWPKENYLKLLNLMKEEFPSSVLLYGGPEEAEAIEYLVEKAGEQVISTGYDNSIKQFFALLDLCDLVVTPDTMPMHVAFGLGKKVIALFGPTSDTEIDTFGRGIKLKADLPCITCYLPTCDVSPNCMESIKPEKVLNSIKKLLK